MQRCIKIEVNCVNNDPVDIKIGGPYFLGFDFFVLESEVEAKIEFIKEHLLMENIPLINIVTHDKIWNDNTEEFDYILLTDQNIWNDERINNCILSEKNYLISQAERAHQRTRF